jgi:S1-C subfamily serine protease
MGDSGVLQALSNDLAGAVERAGRGVVAIHARRRIPSSGIVWRAGIIVAAHHTIERDDDIAVGGADVRGARATLVGRDPTTDIAVLSTDAPLEPVARAEADALRVGALVLALGRPGDDVSASLGVISGVGPEWRTWQGGRIDRLVRLDIDVYDGFSGGPLVGASGAVLGMNSSALARAAAMTIPASTVERVVDQLVREGRVARGFVGLGLQPVRLPEALVAASGLPSDVGLMVVSVEPGGPADAAGVFLGDVVVALGDTAVSDPSELLALLGPESIGASLPVRLVRAGRVESLAITIAERPREPRADASRGRGRRRGR